MLTNILIALPVIGAVLAVIVALRPSEFRVARSAWRQRRNDSVATFACPKENCR
jgi:hypothetical protein